MAGDVHPLAAQPDFPAVFEIGEVFSAVTYRHRADSTALAACGFAPPGRRRTIYPMGKLDGKVALLAGCSPNINGGIALGLAAEGARLVCADVQPAYAEACAGDIRRRGGQAIG